MWEFLTGLVLAAGVFAAAIYWLFPTPLERQNLRDMVLARLFPDRVAKPAPAPPPAPPAETAPPLAFGNIPPLQLEFGTLPDTSLVYEFPERTAPALRYEDFNRRLITFTVNASSSSTKRVWPTVINDEPLRLKGPYERLNYLLKTHFRPRYHVLVDTYGLFASESARLEREPFYSSPLVESYLGIPENERPVVISVANPKSANVPAEFVLARYGFPDLHFDVAFLAPDWSRSLPILFKHFRGPDAEWMYFSRARLRNQAAREDAVLAEIARRLSDETRRSAAEENDESIDTFAELWGIRAERTIEEAVTKEAAE